jgi:RecB family exonuclease
MSRRLTRFDGNLAGVALPAIDVGELSASRLERWVSCPFAFFSEYILGVRTEEEPDPSLLLTALVRGNIIHRSLELLVAEGLESHTLPGPGEAWTGGDHRRLVQLMDEECKRAEARGEAAHPLFWPVIRSRMAAELLDFLRRDSSARASQKATPVAAEYRFGGPTALHLPLPDGRILRFRGAIDRIDRQEDGKLVVLDVKSGKPDRYRSISDDSPFPDGTRLQLPIYGLAASAAGTDSTSAVAFTFVGGNRSGDQRIGYELSPKVLEAFDAVLASIVAGIEAGAFPHNPPAPTWFSGFSCPHCMPDGLDARRLHAACERKADDPTMRLHRHHIADPNAAAGDATDNEVADDELADGPAGEASP